jgi:oligosaccharide repeat unit polymerase
MRDSLSCIPRVAADGGTLLSKSVIDTIGSPRLAYVLLVIVTAAARVRCGSWFAPAAFVGLVWSFFTGASLLIVDYPVPGRGLWILVLLIVAIQLGALIAHELQPQSKVRAGFDRAAVLESLRNRSLRYGLACTAIALAGCVYFLLISLQQFGLPFTPLGVLEVGARWTWLRYDDVIEPWSVRLLVMWLHPAGLLGGVLFGCSRRLRDRILALLTLLPALAYSFLTAARAPALLGLTCWLGGYFTMCCAGEPDRPVLFAWKRVGWFLSVAACLLIGFVSVDALRSVPSDHDFLPEAKEEHIANNMFGSPAAFADWFARRDPESLKWGGGTFAGLYALLGFNQRIVGVYYETSNLVGAEVTNVYTAFRMLVEDFTVAGAVLVSLVFGFVAGLAYSLRSNCHSRTLLLLSAFYAFVIFSPLQSLFSFNGAILAWIIGWLVLRNRAVEPQQFVSDQLVMRMAP